MDQGNENKNSSGVGAESPRPALVNCASCNQPPATNGNQAGCQTEDCWLRSLMGWMSIGLWNSTMNDLAIARVQQSASDMKHGD
jgi:hypothetical protein